ncbi:hypothetical protein CABS03_13587 [Colletotrichum abscissum]
MVSQIENRRRVVGDWDFLQLAPATPTQKPTRSHGLSFDGEATVPVRSGKMTADLSRLVCKEEKRKTTPIVDGVAVKGSESESQKLLSGAAVVGQDNAADPPLASSGQQCETDHLGAKPATAGTAGMQGGLEDTFFDRVDSADTIDNQDADSDIDGIQVAMRRTDQEWLRTKITTDPNNARQHGARRWLKRDAIRLGKTIGVLRRDAAGRQGVLIVVAFNGPNLMLERVTWSQVDVQAGCLKQFVTLLCDRNAVRAM